MQCIQLIYQDSSWWHSQLLDGNFCNWAGPEALSVQQVEQKMELIQLVFTRKQVLSKTFSSINVLKIESCLVASWHTSSQLYWSNCAKSSSSILVVLLNNELHILYPSSAFSQRIFNLILDLYTFSSLLMPSASRQVSHIMWQRLTKEVTQIA